MRGDSPQEVISETQNLNMEQVDRLMRFWRWWFSPRFFNWDRLPARRPLLFVGNHTLYGLVDAPHLLLELYRREGLVLRGLAHHAHYKFPPWGRFLSRYGVVDGTRENCGRLMAAGECVLVYPGGGREVAKRKNERYQLIWKERVGFARMAMRYGCTILPFASLGIEDAWDIVVDSEDMQAGPMGRLIRSAYELVGAGDAIMPLVQGLGPTPFPRPERMYFSFAEPIAVTGDADDTEAAWAIRRRVEAAIYGELEFLKGERERDPKRRLRRRLWPIDQSPR